MTPEDLQREIADARSVSLGATDLAGSHPRPAGTSPRTGTKLDAGRKGRHRASRCPRRVCGAERRRGASIKRLDRHRVAANSEATAPKNRGVAAAGAQERGTLVRCVFQRGRNTCPPAPSSRWADHQGRHPELAESHPLPGPQSRFTVIGVTPRTVAIPRRPSVLRRSATPPAALCRRSIRPGSYRG